MSASASTDAADLAWRVAVQHRRTGVTRQGGHECSCGEVTWDFTRHVATAAVTAMTELAVAAIRAEERENWAADARGAVGAQIVAQRMKILGATIAALGRRA